MEQPPNPANSDDCRVQGFVMVVIRPHPTPSVFVWLGSPSTFHRDIFSPSKLSLFR